MAEEPDSSLHAEYRASEFTGAELPSVESRCVLRDEVPTNLRSLVGVEPDSSLHAEFHADKFTGVVKKELFLPSVIFNPRGAESPIDEQAQDTIINMFNLASAIDLNNDKCDSASMFPFQIVSGITQALHVELPSPPSDERACIAVGSSNSQNENNSTNSLVKAISELATAVGTMFSPKSNKTNRHH